MPDSEIKNLQDLLSFRYGVRTTTRLNPAHANPIIDVVQPALGANPKRLGFAIINMGANNCFAAPRDAVADDFGIMMVPNGGSVTMRWNVDFELVSLPWYVVSVAAPGTDIFVVEVMIF